MSYEPLHHKYRPQTFADLVGQEAIATTLTNAIRTSKIAPAYLFTGPRGTGKTSSARILAKSLNCLKSDQPTEQPCGVCAVCKGIANGSTLDVTEIDAASNTGVDNIREIIERAQFAPVQCRYKVYVIDECLTGDSLVQTSEGLIRIDDPNIKGKKVLSYNESSGAWEFKKVVRWLDQGERQTIVIKTTNREIRCTGNHLIRTEQGWIPAKNVKEGVKILSPVNAAAAPSFTNLGRIGAPGDLLVDTSSKATHTDKSYTILPLSWNRQKPFDLSVLADAVKSLMFLPFYKRKATGLGAFSHAGKSIHTKKDTEFGTSAQKSWFPRLKFCHQKRWDLSTEPCWETVASPTPTNTADSLDWLGHTEKSSRNGWNIKPIAFQLSNQSYEFHQIRDTEVYQSVAAHPVIPTLKMFLTLSNRMGIKKPSLWTGSIKLPQKDLLGGSWMMVHSASARKEVHGFGFIQKDTPHKKIKLSLVGLQKSVIQQKQSFTQGLTKARHTTTYTWAQTQLESGCQTLNSIQFPQWITSSEIVESVKVGGVERVYDIEVEYNHNFVANGLLAHNCHMLSVAAFNALLKTLEEPPDRVVFVLATTDPQRVLPTIISRCQRFDFRRIAIDAMVKHLWEIASIENISISREALTLIAQVSQGGLRDAESLLDQLSLLSGQITVERVWDLVGSCSEPDLIALLQAIAQNHPESVLDRARSLMDRGREPLTVLQNLAGFYRDLLIAKTAPERNDLVAVTPSTWTQMCDYALSWDIPTILRGQHHLKDSEVQIKNTTQPRLWLEVTLLGLLPAANNDQPVAIFTQPLANVVRQPREPNTQPTTAQQPPAPPNPEIAPPAPEIASPAPEIAPEIASPAPEIASPASPAPVDTPREQIWQQVLANLQPISTRELLRQMCRLVEFDGASARIGITSQPWYKKTQAHLPNITAAFLETFKREVQVSLELLTPNKTKAPSAHERQTPATGTAPAKSSPMAEPIANHRAAASSSQVSAHTQFQAETKQDRSTPPKVSEAPKSEVATYTLTEQTHRSAPTADWEDDEAVLAAQRLADFFNGEVVKLNLDIAFAHGAETNNPPSIVKPTEDWNELDTEEEDDIEF